jgi:hypothetical protein
MYEYLKHLIINIFLYNKKKYHRRPDWSKELQTSPPNFGNAKRISDLELAEINNYKLKIRPKYSYFKKKNNTIAIVILTCKREKSLESLIKNLNFFLTKIENFKSYVIYVVDNESDKEKNMNLCKKFKIDHYIYFKNNIGMSNALRKVFNIIDSEYILFIEDDFNIKYKKPFLKNCIDIFNEFKDIGIIRLKNQNNWHKKNRVISNLRTTSSKIRFWTWVPNGTENGWCAGSVMFKKKYLDLIGGIPYSFNINRFQFYIYENYIAKKFNKFWNAAKIENCYPFYQNNDTDPIL